MATGLLLEEEVFSTIASLPSHSIHRGFCGRHCPCFVIHSCVELLGLLGEWCQHFAFVNHRMSQVTQLPTRQTQRRKSLTETEVVTSMTFAWWYNTYITLNLTKLKQSLRRKVMAENRTSSITLHDFQNDSIRGTLKTNRRNRSKYPP